MPISGKWAQAREPSCSPDIGGSATIPSNRTQHESNDRDDESGIKSELGSQSSDVHGLVQVKPEPDWNQASGFGVVSTPIVLLISNLVTHGLICSGSSLLSLSRSKATGNRRN